MADMKQTIKQEVNRKIAEEKKQNPKLAKTVKDVDVYHKKGKK